MKKKTKTVKVWILHPKYHEKDLALFMYFDLSAKAKKSGNYIRATITYFL